VRTIVSQEAIQEKVQKLGRRISSDYRDKNPVLVTILKGGVIFLADLIRHISIPVQLDFMALSSYGGSTESSGVVRILQDLSTNISGRHVIVIEDIVDTGLTLNYILENLKTRHPASLKVCALLDKRRRHRLSIAVDYLGFVIPDVFVVGYGLDLGEHHRNIPYVVAVDGGEEEVAELNGGDWSSHYGSSESTTRGT
jgi:hypoxanthine phosphoribosyltransferase